MAKTKANGKVKQADSRERPTATQIVKQIREHASRTTPDPVKFAAGARYSTATMKSRRFNYDRRTADGAIIHYFHTPGETLVGVLGESQKAQIPRGTSASFEYLFPLVLDDDSLVYLPNNKRLRKVIDKAKCLFQRIKITYEGRLATAYGHYEKVYSVEPAPLGKDGVGPAGRELLKKAAADAKSKRAAKVGGGSSRRAE